MLPVGIAPRIPADCSPTATVLPTMLHCQLRDRILLVRLDRPEKRNALSDTLMRALAETLRTVPNEAAAVVIHGSGEHFCAGLDLAELRER
ncbi:MAG: enoyl-CoA hydratase-related protein, partial [Casimicrobiaceae bacterium]|nr:enoyl-CoA hydratase-related protein [Casimicrobiaceae bacterium]